jgi:hypothetical protein
MRTAASLKLAAPSTARNGSPLARWHLLSLDAPTVAALWTWFLARANRIHLPLASCAAMFLAVWILYVADRLLDARHLHAHPLDAQGLEARHLFHHRHRAAFLSGIVIAATLLAALLPRLEPAAIRLYLIEAALLFAWFIVLHATGSAHRLPKEIAVGLCFAAAVFIPTVAREPALRLPLIAPALLFAALCSLNCLYIYAWEHAPPHPQAHASTRLALRHLPLLALTTATASLALLASPAPRPIPAAIALACLLLLLLDRHRLTPTHLRAAADLALLTPLLLLPFLR